ncbi:MAG: hypothetical protein LBF36_01245 [Mycoplasmataceae bacterium]|jgi:aspartyl/glutamyl-tRNA(Asn/Gln) amidotransferase C subunit|nr:hypothetical protein [Mycoplasmataceae bacterium]
MKINKEIFQEAALSLYFVLDEPQLERLYIESTQLFTSLENLNNLNVDNVSPMHYPFSHSFSALREDKVVKIYDTDNYLKNAKHHQGKYIVVK